MLVSHCAPRLGGRGAALAGSMPGGFCTPRAPGELCPGYQLSSINTRMKTARPPQPLEQGRRGGSTSHPHVSVLQGKYKQINGIVHPELRGAGSWWQSSRSLPGTARWHRSRLVRAIMERFKRSSIKNQLNLPLPKPQPCPKYP